MRRSTAVLLGGVVIIFELACRQEWRLFPFPEERLGVEFPGEPKTKASMLSTPCGQLAEQRHWFVLAGRILRGGASSFSVSTYSCAQLNLADCRACLSRDLEVFLASEALSPGMAWRVDSEVTTSFAGMTCRAFRASVAADETRLFLVGRIIRRSDSLVCARVVRSGVPPRDSDVEHFFGSLQLR